MDNYEDIINLPHPVSKRHIRMSAEDRAAQFAPFAALTGYDDAVRKAAIQAEEKWDESYSGKDNIWGDLYNETEGI